MLDLHYIAISDGVENQHGEEGEPTTIRRETR